MESERVFSMSDFYEFSSCGYMTTFAASADEFERCLSFGDGSAGDRFYSKLILGDYKDIHMPVTYREMGYGASGKKMRDILDTRFHQLCLISDRFRRILEDTGMTGWKSYPIVLYDRKGNQIKGYNGFSVVGRAGKMQKYETPPIEMGYSPESSGYHFDIKTWDGSDLFITEGSWHVIASKQFIKLLVENKITACEYCSLTDYGDWSKIKRLH